MIRNLVAMALVLAASSGCGTTVHYTPTNRPPRPLVAHPATMVDVFTAGVPARPFVEIGLLQARQSSESSLDDMPEIIGAMRDEAGRLGCDGIIILGSRDKQIARNAPEGTTAASGATLEGFWGTCIVYVAHGESTATSSGSPLPAPPVAPPPPLAAPPPEAAPPPPAASPAPVR